MIAIDDLTVLVGALPSTALKLVTEWATLHRDELAADWECVITGTPPDPIEPLP